MYVKILKSPNFWFLVINLIIGLFVPVIQTSAKLENTMGVAYTTLFGVLFSNASSIVSGIYFTLNLIPIMFFIAYVAFGFRYLMIKIPPLFYLSLLVFFGFVLTTICLFNGYEFDNDKTIELNLSWFTLLYLISPIYLMVSFLKKPSSSIKNDA